MLDPVGAGGAVGFLLGIPVALGIATSPAGENSYLISRARACPDHIESPGESCPRSSRAPTPCLLRPRKTWVAGTGPAMTTERLCVNRPESALSTTAYALHQRAR